MWGLSGALIIRLGLLVFLICWQLTMSTELIPERAEVCYINEKYAKNVTVYIRRTGRRSPYYFNVGATILGWFGNNVSLHGVFYEYLHNEYKRSFVEIELTMCDLFKKEPWRSFIGTTLEAQGFICPIPPGTYKFQNISVSMVNFPYVMPFEKAMLEGFWKLSTTQEILARARFYVTFKRDIPKRN